MIHIRKWLCFLLASVLFGLTAAACAQGIELLPNGGFEELDGNLPKGWYTNAYHSAEGYTRFSISTERVHSGNYAVCIENAAVNDARYVYTVSVEPETMYRLSAYVLVERMQDIGNGANLSLEEFYCVSDCLFTTNDEWQQIEWYGLTGPKQKELTFSVRVGGYSSESIGKAYFDDVSLVQVDTLPQDVTAALWYREQTISPASDSKTNTPVTHPYLFVLIAAVFAVACAALYKKYQNGFHFSLAIYILLMLLALAARLLLAANVKGYSVDIGCFSAWSLRMASVGPAEFYAPDYFCDYPPGMMLLLWPVGLLLQQFPNAAELCVKLLPILCDIIAAVLLYREIKKTIEQRTAMLVSLLYVFLPAVIINSSAWGQMDSLLALMLLITVICCRNKNLKYAIPIYFVSVLVKPQALLVGPLALIWLIISLVEAKRTNRFRSALQDAAAGLRIGILTAVAVLLPFSIHQANLFSWIISQYSDTLSSYPYVTLNTANLYYLLGCNWMKLDQVIPIWIPIATSIIFAAFSVYLYINKKDIKKQKLCGILCSLMAIANLLFCFADVSYAVYAYSWMACCYAYVIISMCLDRDVNHLPFWMALILITLYVFGPKIHERYLFPALLLLFLCYAYTRDMRLLLLSVGFACTTFINVGIILDNATVLGAASGHLNTDTLALNDTVAVCNLILCTGTIVLSCFGLQPSKQVEPVVRKTAFAKRSTFTELLIAPPVQRARLRLADYLIIGGVTVAYGIFTLSTLGSIVAPQTAWVSTAYDEQVILELEDAAEFSVLYYAGVSYDDFSISVSEDGENWSEAYPCQMNQGLCYRWNYAVTSSGNGEDVSYSANRTENILWLHGKYLCVNAESVGLNLWEIVARDRSGVNIPMHVINHLNANTDMLDDLKPAAHLVDETDTCVGEPSWYNGTYFDEIYYARTAYEHLHGQKPYETTHPPLGKLLMSACVAVFGMTPFGWRFAGAFAGILMLPAMYLLAYRIIRKRWAGIAAITAFALDLMHFTQTRLATIDSFAVLFILYSYVFMLRYLSCDPFAVSSDSRMASNSFLGYCRLRLICLIDAVKGNEHMPVADESSSAEEAPYVSTEPYDHAFIRNWKWLLFSGIAMGLSIASKWTGIYSAVGLAILFFIGLYRQYAAGAAAKRVTEDEYLSQTDENANNVQSHIDPIRVQIASKLAVRRGLATCAFCCICFILIPLAIYCLCYVPYLKPTGPVTLKRILDAQMGMLSYHSTPGLGMDHPYYSPWWQWPLILKPMWFFQGAYEPSGFASTIVCMGNPIIFWIGAAAMALLLLLALYRLLFTKQHDLAAVESSKAIDRCAVFAIAIGFLAQYLPWVLVPRGTYMYHYFAAVPFIIFATVYWISRMRSRNLRIAAIAVYLAACAVFFVMFLPYASGFLTDTKILDAMKWFKGIYY